MVRPQVRTPAGSAARACRNWVMMQTKPPPSAGSYGWSLLAANLAGSLHASTAGSISGLETTCVAAKATTPASKPANAQPALRSAGRADGRGLTIPVRSSKWRRRAASLTARTAGSRPMRVSSSYACESFAPLPTSVRGSGATRPKGTRLCSAPRRSCESVTRSCWCGDIEYAWKATSVSALPSLTRSSEKAGSTASRSSAAASISASSAAASARAVFMPWPMEGEVACAASPRMRSCSLREW
mmetsp:Transcript_22602/g.76303  ORF Transcript_22602/g.76303 Transcript_22602/m.76303 type:complete len:243 (+) Transcript_22602:661-1389(+)